jgi:hypothetical protein
MKNKINELDENIYYINIYNRDLSNYLLNKELECLNKNDLDKTNFNVNNVNSQKNKNEKDNDDINSCQNDLIECLNDCDCIVDECLSQTDNLINKLGTKRKYEEIYS